MLLNIIWLYQIVFPINPKKIPPQYFTIKTVTVQAAEASFFSGKLRLPYNKRAWVGSENLSRNHAIT